MGHSPTNVMADREHRLSILLMNWEYIYQKHFTHDIEAIKNQELTVDTALGVKMLDEFLKIHKKIMKLLN